MLSGNLKFRRFMLAPVEADRDNSEEAVVFERTLAVRRRDSYCLRAYAKCFGVKNSHLHYYTLNFCANLGFIISILFISDK